VRYPFNGIQVESCMMDVFFFPLCDFLSMIVYKISLVESIRSVNVGPLISMSPRQTDYLLTPPFHTFSVEC
jgi:hypothetical protein